MPSLDVIAFDADDTLWHTEQNYTAAQEVYVDLLAPYADRETAKARLLENEIENLTTYGYGTRSFVLSMIETALALSDHQISAEKIQRLIDVGRDMLIAEVEVLDYVSSTLEALEGDHTLMVITKGDLLEQESKLARSGIAEYFSHVEVVSKKTTDVYARLLRAYRLDAASFMMVGNSLKSDVLPVLELGAYGVHVPYAVTWAHEVVNVPPDELPHYYELTHLGELPDLVARLEQWAGRR